MPSALGPSDPSTNITWHASANGTYSVRVGGTDCSTGTQVATGSYSTSPANVVTNILASQLAEGTNTIRVCVTDAVPSTGSATTTVTKDSLAPSVTIVVRRALGARRPPIPAQHHLERLENGTYSVRVGGNQLLDGDQVATGTYSTSPDNVVTTSSPRSWRGHQHDPRLRHR